MGRFASIRDHLPTLYRPEDNDTSLLTQFLQALARLLDDLDNDATAVLQAHWFAFADRGLYSRYLNRLRQIEKLPPLTANDPSLLEFPFIDDLARLSSMLSIPPVTAPPSAQDTVETYRLRMARIVALYRNGLSTPDALRAMTEAQLPVDETLPDEVRDRPFFLEEFPGLTKLSLAAHHTIKSVNMLGPLMRWQISNDGIAPVLPTVYIQGVPPKANEIDATDNPLIELYQAGAVIERLGIAFQATLAPGQTLRLRPLYNSWLGSETGLQQASSEPDPTAPGPWAAAAGAPAIAVAAIVQTIDKMLWLAGNNAGAGELWRFDGTTWTQTLNALSPARCLFENRGNLLIGVDAGLLQMPLFPGGAFTAAPVAGVTDAINTIFRTRDGQLWLGAASGAKLLDSAGTVTDSPLTGVAVSAVAEDATGVVFFGTALGVFEFLAGTGQWFWFSGEEASEEVSEWQPFFPEKTGADRNFPTANQVFLPPVTAVLRGDDSSLWLGTERGFARYTARSEDELARLAAQLSGSSDLARTLGQTGRGLVFQTVLEAFPDLTVGRVASIHRDERGLVWFATDRGLFRYDGRDFWQFQGTAWVQLGRADTLEGDSPRPRGAWRFHRPSGQWQRFDPISNQFIPFTDTPRSQAEAAIQVVAWTDSTIAELGSWDGTTFSNAAPADSSKLLVRFKPDELTIRNGGIPAIPRLSVGSSLWRYLSVEPANLPDPASKPSWTIEGRLIPPPPDKGTPAEGRFDITAPPPPNVYDTAAFAYNPAARVWFEWHPRLPFEALIRLKTRTADEQIDASVLDRVFKNLDQVRPAGVRVALAVEENIVRGVNNASS